MENLYADCQIPENQVYELIDSTIAFSVENQAMNYLNRSEHSRFLLTQKLLKKGFDSKGIEKALDYLESLNYLSDYRFAMAWLRTRRLSVSEGRSKLHSELLSRGVNAKIAKEALDEFFEEFPEEELIEKAIEKLKRMSCPQEKLTEKLMKKGFSMSLIKKSLK
ncbi:MAG: RecX family transcriptional regulator [Treponemataceae bacterium]|nr:RecX family transcriptional regulator [Treponemataceae bacterium]